MRPYYMAIGKELYKWPRLCVGETPRHKVMLNYIEQVYFHINDAMIALVKMLFSFFQSTKVSPNFFLVFMANCLMITII